MSASPSPHAPDGPRSEIARRAERQGSRTSSRLILLAGAVVVLVVLVIAALYAVVPGDPDSVDEAVGTLEVQAYEPPATPEPPASP